MKKIFFSVLTAALILTSITACHANGTADPFEEQGSTADISVSNSNNESSSNISERIPPEKVIGIYGETDIPDIPGMSSNPEGKANDLDWEVLGQCLDSMIFETHAFGEYTIRLVGNLVRTDEVNFPGSIYTHNLRVEVEKNGKPLELRDSAHYCNTLFYVSQLATEFILFSDRIGSYLDIYDLEEPLIAMRYFYADNIERTVTKAVDFAVIKDEELVNGFVGIFEKGTGIELNPDTDSKDRLILNTDSNTVCRVGIFEADEFKTADKNTLIDEEAGLKYTFNFSEPLQFELYKVERIE